MSGIRAILFDMDGLMVDTEPIYWQVARQLAQQHGATVPDATLRRMMGRSRIEAMQVLIKESGITGVAPAELLSERERLILARYASGVEPMPGLIEAIDRFHGWAKLGVVTSAPQTFADAILPGLGLMNRFDVIQTGDDIIRGKPDPEIYLKAIGRLMLEPRECVVIEDSQAGALAGHRAGAFVIAVPTQLTAEEDFAFADARVGNLHEAAEWIEKLV